MLSLYVAGCYVIEGGDVLEIVEIYILLHHPVSYTVRLRYKQTTTPTDQPTHHHRLQPTLRTQIHHPIPWLQEMRYHMHLGRLPHALIDDGFGDCFVFGVDDHVEVVLGGDDDFPVAEVELEVGGPVGDCVLAR